MLLEIVMALKN